MLEFFSENYVWLIVIGVFIIMIIIGYFADKNQNKEKKPKLKDHVDELDNQENETNDVKIDEWEENPVPKEEDEVIEVKGLDNSFDSWDENMENFDVNTEETTENSNEEFEPSSQEPVVENEESNSEEPIVFPEVEESLNENNVETNEEPVEEATETSQNNVEESNPIEDLEITLPNIDTLNEEIKDVVDAEDVWKF